MIIQTHNADQPCIQAVIRHDYQKFVTAELDARRQHGYPPFTRLARIICEALSAPAAKERCGKIVTAVKRIAPAGVTVLGPEEAPIARIRNRFRYHALLKARDSRTLHEALSAVERKPAGSVQVIIDVDPVSLL